MGKVSDKIIGLILFSFIIILPYSYENISDKWIILFILFIAGLIGLHYLQWKNRLKIYNIQIILAIFFMIIYDNTENVNFIRQFNLSIITTWRIPLSTIFLIIGTFIFLIKIIIEEKIQIINHPFIRYFFCSCVALLMFIVSFYPFLYFHYKFNFDSNIQLFSKIFKYVIILLIVIHFTKDEVKLRQVNMGLISSLCITVLLNLIL